MYNDKNVMDTFMTKINESKSAVIQKIKNEIGGEFECIVKNSLSSYSENESILHIKGIYKSIPVEFDVFVDGTDSSKATTMFGTLETRGGCTIRLNDKQLNTNYLNDINNYFKDIKESIDDYDQAVQNVIKSLKSSLDIDVVRIVGVTFIKNKATNNIISITPSYKQTSQNTFINGNTKSCILEGVIFNSVSLNNYSIGTIGIDIVKNLSPEISSFSVLSFFL